MTDLMEELDVDGALRETANGATGALRVVTPVDSSRRPGSPGGAVIGGRGRARCPGSGYCPGQGRPRRARQGRYRHPRTAPDAGVSGGRLLYPRRAPTEASTGFIGEQARSRRLCSASPPTSRRPRRVFCRRCSARRRSRSRTSISWAPPPNRGQVHRHSVRTRERGCSRLLGPGGQHQGGQGPEGRASRSSAVEARHASVFGLILQGTPDFDLPGWGVQQAVHGRSGVPCAEFVQALHFIQ